LSIHGSLYTEFFDCVTPYRSSTALFCQMSLLNHDCLPNTRTVIHENSSDFSLFMNLYASTEIWKGENITQQYVPVVKGTPFRRKALKEWFFDCICNRCSDPTEFKTYFSCLQCMKCWVGYLVPEDSLNYDSIYRCSNTESCGHSLSSKEVQELVQNYEDLIKSEENSSTEVWNTLLKKILSERIIHNHHFVAINLQYEITQRIVKGLNNEKDFELIPQCVQYCKNILQIVDVISPGYSYYRGVILYFLGNLLYCLYEEWNSESPDITSKKQTDMINIKEIVETIREGVIIMSVEPEGSIYREMADELESYEATITSCYS